MALPCRGQVNRIAGVRPQALTQNQKVLYEAIASGPRSRAVQHVPLTDEHGALQGPFNAFLLSPHLGHRLQELGASLRYEAGLPPLARELAILAVAAHESSDYEWFAHEPVARECGATESDLAQIRAGDEWTSGSRVERAVLRVASTLIRDRDVDDVAYREALLELSEPQVFEILTLVGYYQMLALQLRVFRVSP